MKERPILFSGPMVRAILDGRKTQTRRIIKPQPLPTTDGIRYLDEGWAYEAILESKTDHRQTFVPNPEKRKSFQCPYGKPGDLLWVRESFRWLDAEYCEDKSQIQYQADADFQIVPDNLYSEDQVFSRLITWTSQNPGRWKPSIHMPRWASRITLEITDVRVERLHQISEDDAKAEGMQFHDGGEIHHSGWRWDKSHGVVYKNCRNAFAYLWQSINGPESWNANPWVWVVEFRRIEA